MFYQEALPNFRFLSHVDNVQKSKISKFTSVCGGFSCWCFFKMVAYKRSEVVVIKMDAYIHGVLTYFVWVLIILNCINTAQSLILQYISISLSLPNNI